MDDGFKDAIKKYGEGHEILDKAVDDLQREVSIKY